MKKLLLFSCLIISLLPLYSQVNAKFTVSDTIGCNPLLIKFYGPAGTNYIYTWDFGGIGISHLQNPTFTFANPNPETEFGEYMVTLVVTDTVTSAVDTKSLNIYVNLTPSAKLEIDTTHACVNGDIEFATGFDQKDAAEWSFGDGTYSKENISVYVYHAYKNNGVYNGRFITHLKECSDTFAFKVNVHGPVSNFSVSQEKSCIGIPIKYTYDKTSTGVTAHSWKFSDRSVSNADTVIHKYSEPGSFITQLTVSGPSGSCLIDDTVNIVQVKASFIYEQSSLFCDEQYVNILNTSVGNDKNFWDFGNGNTSTGSNSAQKYSKGTYTITLKITNDLGCSDSTKDEIIIHKLPDLILTNDTIICKGNSIELKAISDAQNIFWWPSTGLSNTNTKNPVASPDSTIKYNVILTDTITKCQQYGKLTITVQNQINTENITVFPLDTSIIIGTSIRIISIDKDSLSRNLSYLWTPDENISCTTCKSPTVQPLTSKEYTLKITDPYYCFTPLQFNVNVNVNEKYIIGVPDAFSPNGDFNNDFIKVDGWGIKKLIEFRIYNRWGTEVFFTDDIESKWDGYYKGKLQNIDSYAYVIKAEMWDNNIVTKKGTFSLIR